MEKINSISQSELAELTEYLPPNWKQLARETRALSRMRNTKTEEDLLALSMFYITNDGLFQLTSVMMKLSRCVSVNKNAVYKRITSSGEWMRRMAESLCQSSSSTASCF